MSSQNPAPEDLSLFEEQPDPIKVPSESSLTVPSYSAIGGETRLSPTGQLEYISIAPVSNPDASDPRGRDQIPNSKRIPPEPAAPTADNGFMDAIRRTAQSTGFGNDPLGEFGLGSITKNLTVSKTKTAKSISPKKPVFASDLSAISIDPRTNELNSFSSYTYNIALYMMDSRNYVNLMTVPNNPQAALDQAILLMRSGGTGPAGRDTQLERDLGFFNNFFIDDLHISNVAVGPNKFKQNTNAVDINFSIQEPRGVTLIERLRNAARTVLSTTGEPYIKAPYLLEITFKGYDELGQPIPNSSLPKYIPIQITNIEFDVTEAGTIYNVQAIPYSHSLYGKINSTVPINVEVKANTIGNIFTEGVQQLNQETENVRTFTEFGDPTTIQQTKMVLGEKAANLGEILTRHQQERTQEKTTEKDTHSPFGDETTITETIPADAEFHDTYSFMIADEIASATLYTDDLFDALASPQAKGESKNDGNANRSQFESYVRGLAGNVKLDKKTQVFTINAGTDLIKLMNLLIMHSSYISDNVRQDIANGTGNGQGVKWFSIKPIITSASGPGTGYDAKDGRYKYHITYVIEPSLIHYHDFPWAPKSKPQGTGIHKVYNYIYAGNNTEVLDFKLNFKTAFVQTMTNGTGNLSNQTSDNDMVKMVAEMPFPVEGNTINQRDNLDRTRAKDLFSSIMSDGVDLMDLGMSIVGDPAYIPTSDFYWQDRARNGQSYTGAFMPDGTINYNLGPPYIQVNLKTPVDYDETTGLANPSQYGNSTFSGVYRLTSIDSSFSGGQFQQKLNGFRTHLQPSDVGTVRSGVSANNERSAFNLDTFLSDTVKPVAKNVGRSLAKVINDPDASDPRGKDQIPVTQSRGPSGYDEIPQNLLNRRQDAFDPRGNQIPVRVTRIQESTYDEVPNALLNRAPDAFDPRGQ